MEIFTTPRIGHIACDNPQKSLVQNCRACDSKSVRTFFDLGEQPFANALLKNEKEFKTERKYPLSLSFCNDCKLVQLDYTADPKELFENYFWVTSTSTTAIMYSETFCVNVLKRSSIKTYVLEVASNDGTFLQPFKLRDFEILGVDPAYNICEMANERGIPTKNEFFGKRVATDIIRENGFPSVVFARNVLPHVANLHDFMDGLKACMSNETMLVIECHYAGVICEELHYDSIYHEHLCYFTVKSLENLLKRYGLYAFDIEESPISGGSIVLYIRNTPVRKTQKLIDFEKIEEQKRCNEFSTWEHFSSKSFEHKRLLLELLDKYKGRNIIAYGASARGSTLLNFCGIDFIHAIIDKNELKLRLYTPGTHLKIVGINEGMSLNPEVILVTAWNFKDEIIETLRESYNFNGTVITPLPFPPHAYEISIR